jgi:hypothetical protein
MSLNFEKNVYEKNLYRDSSSNNDKHEKKELYNFCTYNSDCKSSNCENYELCYGLVKDKELCNYVKVCKPSDKIITYSSFNVKNI